MSVSIQVGWIVPTATPWCATSSRSALHIASTPAFEAAYADIPGACANDASEAVTATYPRASITAGSAARTVWDTPTTLTAIVRPHAAGAVSVSGPNEAMPAFAPTASRSEEHTAEHQAR